jgi:hypothetical protein
VGLTMVSPSMSLLSRQCGILNISQPYRPPRPDTGIAFFTPSSYVLITDMLLINFRRQTYWESRISFKKIPLMAIKKIQKYSGLRAGRERGQNSRLGRVKNFNLSKSSTQPPIQWVPGALSQVVKRRRRETDQSPSTSVEVKKTWVYTSTPSYVVMA